MQFVKSRHDTCLKRAEVEDGQRFMLWRHFQALHAKSDATYCTQHDCRLLLPNGISKAQPAAFNTRHDFFEMVQLRLRCEVVRIVLVLTHRGARS